MKFKQLFCGIATASAVLFTTGAQASVIKGGSELLSNSDADQLATWLGQGAIDFTNIYTKRSGDNANTFHNNVDGKGASIVVMRATDHYGFSGIIGGYNPKSWASTGGYTTTHDVADRTAFLFNLSNDSLFRQNTYGGYYSVGSYQSVSEYTYGPTFGGGHDLYVDYALTSGYSYLWSYSNYDGYSNGNMTTSILNGSYWQGNYMSINQLEVFTIAESAEVPEPGNLALFGLALFGLTAVRRSRAKK